MVFRDLAKFKAQDVSMYMYIPTLVIRGFFSAHGKSLAPRVV